MYRRAMFILGLVSLAIVATTVTADAADQSLNTTIVIKGMHCQACAKKVIAQLQQVPGVAAANADAKRGLAAAAPASAQQLPSPRAQWEAIVKAGFTPLALYGPFGTFKQKPAN